MLYKNPEANRRLVRLLKMITMSEEILWIPGSDDKPLTTVNMLNGSVESMMGD